MRHARTNLLTILILLGLVAGALVGQFVVHDPAVPIGADHWMREVGDVVLIRPLKLLIIPLIFFSVIAGISRIGDPARLGLVGGATLVYYLATMLLAVVLGTTLVSWLQPGVLPTDAGAAMIAASESAWSPSGGQSLGSAWMNIVHQVIPVNIVQDMAAGRPLGVIVFAILFALALSAGGERTEAARRFFDACFEGMMLLVRWVIWLTPIGVFFLVAWTVGRIGLDQVGGPLGAYMGTVLLGLAVHGFIVLPLVLWLCTRKNPFRFMWQMQRALFTAIGTDSSSATLPVTIDTAENEGECSKRAANFVLPLGSTINMDGTALYEAVAVVFLFQLYGVDLAFSQLVVVVITATLAAIGAAGIPSAGLVTMVIVISAVNTSLTGSATEGLPLAAIGFIIGVDRLLDMCRTAINVWGDAVGAKIISRIA
ncbi:MAG: dicarboxylate/amino acid:cation symporter [Phycisphaerales bacterium]|nr:dicarboxylate/amino acid:cation symporter [Phycisphaerales bacterium]